MNHDPAPDLRRHDDGSSPASGPRGAPRSAPNPPQRQGARRAPQAERDPAPRSDAAARTGAAPRPIAPIPDAVEASEVRLPVDPLRRFVESLLVRVGAFRDEAHLISRALVWCDLTGRHTDGCAAVPRLVERLERGLIRSPSRATFRVRAHAVHILDGGDGFGRYLGQVGMERAIALAEDHGIGVVAVRSSNDFGSAAYYADLAARHDQVGIALGNSPPGPEGGEEAGARAFLGMNPVAFAAPLPGSEGHGAEHRPILVELPSGSNTPAGPFGPALVVELLAGVLSGAGLAGEIGAAERGFAAPANRGHLFVSVDVGAFLPDAVYGDRIGTLTRLLSGVDPETASSGDPSGRGLPSTLRYPGAESWDRFHDGSERGVPLAGTTIQGLAELAAEARVEVPW